jgi:hypothetical protein
VARATDHQHRRQRREREEKKEREERKRKGHRSKRYIRLGVSLVGAYGSMWTSRASLSLTPCCAPMADALCSASDIEIVSQVYL